MKKRKIILKILLTLLVTPFLLTSCSDDPEPPALEGLPDVLIQKIFEGGEERYAIAFWVFGNKELESVTVEGPGGGFWELDSDSPNHQIFSLYPEAEDYTTSIPSVGIYEFTITSTQEGEAPMIINDGLGDEVLAVVAIDSVKFDNSLVTAYWETVTGADNYRIRLYNDSGEIIFLSEQIANNKTNYSFDISNDGWYNSSSIPETGDNCRIELLAILYESDVIVGEDYNIQCISIASDDIVWGD